jgi:low temperature requirement protein LtrA
MAESDELKVSPLELFFDLVFVFAITQIVALIEHDLSPAGVAKGALVLAMIYWGWSMFTWTLNAVGTDRLDVRLGLLAAMAMSLLMALVIPDAFGTGGPYFVGAYFVFRLAASMAALLSADPERRRAQWRFIPLTMVAGVVAVVGGFVDDPARTWIWLASLLIDLAAARVAVEGDWQIRAGHFAERYGLLVIIALGELIVAIGVGLSGSEVDLSLGVTLVVAVLATGLLWWSYFDWVADRVEEYLRSLSGTAQGAFARDAYTILHYPLVAGIVLFAVVVAEITAHPTDALDALPRTLLALGFALVLLSFVASAYRSTRRIPYARLGAAVIIGLVSILGRSLGGLVLLSVDSAVIFAMLVYEHWARRHPDLVPTMPPPATGSS